MMKKKIMSVVMSIVMLFGMAFSFTGCSIESRFDSDGKFKYYYNEESKGYTIVAIEEDGYTDPLYWPAYYKGELTTGIGYYKATIAQPIVYYPDFKDIQKMYFAFNHRQMIEFVSEREYYFANSYMSVSFSFLGIKKKDVLYKDLYINSYRFLELIEEIEKKNENYYSHYQKKKLDYQLYDGYLKIRLNTQDNNIVLDNNDWSIVRIANTSYIFNYEDAPNEGYFFINNFEQGEKITNTPYEPLREGYVFDGWYKEPECINKCNFGVDTYVEQYDENGELIFNELKLYAKWRESTFWDKILIFLNRR